MNPKSLGSQLSDSAKNNECSVQVSTAIKAIGGKWKLLILGHLLDQSKRYNELRRLIPDISQKMLSQQLRELEKEGLVERMVYPEVPPRVEYKLTEYGQTLKPIFEVLNKWGANHLIRQG
jgi:DNA-binding HxlR family transcriptional regulator